LLGGILDFETEGNW